MEWHHLSFKKDGVWADREPPTHRTMCPVGVALRVVATEEEVQKRSFDFVPSRVGCALLLAFDFCSDATR